MGFPKGDAYLGTPEQDAQLERQFTRKAEFMYRLGTPIWNGEFGPVYADPQLDESAAQINERRHALLARQLAIYDKYQCHWTIWLYKDIGLQGMVHLDPSSKWMRTIAPFQAKKRALMLDAWGRRPSEQVEAVIGPLVEWIRKVAPNSDDAYPTPWNTERQIIRLVNQLWLSGCVSDEFAGLFAGMTFEELDECARSFHFDACLQREGLNRALEAHAEVPALEVGTQRPPNLWLQSKATSG